MRFLLNQRLGCATGLYTTDLSTATGDNCLGRPPDRRVRPQRSASVCARSFKAGTTVSLAPTVHFLRLFAPFLQQQGIQPMDHEHEAADPKRPHQESEGVGVEAE